MDSIIKRVLKDEWDSVQEDIEKMAAAKVMDKINDKKIEILADLNGTTVDKIKELTTKTVEEPTKVEPEPTQVEEPAKA
jgi:hypothetical protein